MKAAPPPDVSLASASSVHADLTWTEVALAGLSFGGTRDMDSCVRSSFEYANFPAPAPPPDVRRGSAPPSS